MKIGVLKENKSKEKRVALTPSTVTKIKKLGHDITIERDAGSLSNFFDSSYEEAGASITSTEEIFKCDIILKINKPTDDEIEKLSANQTLISFFSPATNAESLQLCKKDKLNILC